MKTDEECRDNRRGSAGRNEQLWSQRMTTLPWLRAIGVQLTDIFRLEVLDRLGQPLIASLACQKLGVDA